ncbi:MAG: response regulator [Bacteroidota bacterium]
MPANRATSMLSKYLRTGTQNFVHGYNSFQKTTPIQLIEAKNSVEAIALLQRHPYSLVLLNMHLPQMSGIEAIRHIR